MDLKWKSCLGGTCPWRFKKGIVGEWHSDHIMVRPRIVKTAIDRCHRVVDYSRTMIECKQELCRRILTFASGERVDRGTVTVGSINFHCCRRHGHGRVATDAIARGDVGECNAYVVKLIERSQRLSVFLGLECGTADNTSQRERHTADSLVGCERGNVGKPYICFMRGIKCQRHRIEFLCALHPPWRWQR